MKELEALAAFCHGGLASGHLLGVYYNLKRKNYWDAAFHGLVFLYDLRSTIVHHKEAK